MTTTKHRWKRGPVRLPDGDGPTGYHLGNLAVYDTGGIRHKRARPWRIVHQPSGLMAAEARTLRDAKWTAEHLMNRFGPEAFDRLADRDSEYLDYDTLQAIKRAARETPPTA